MTICLLDDAKTVTDKNDHTSTTSGLRHGTQFGVPTRDSVRGDAWRCGSGEVVRAMSWQKF